MDREGTIGMMGENGKDMSGGVPERTLRVRRCG